MEQIDLFGVPICHLSNKNNQRYQSMFGGINTNFLSSLSLEYFLYVIILQINIEIAPSISSKQKTLDYAEFQLQESMIEFTLEDKPVDVDLFKKENNSITPVLVTFMNTTVQVKPITLYSYDQKSQRTEQNNVNLVLNIQDSIDEIQKLQEQHTIVLARCSSQFLIEGSNCADKKKLMNIDLDFMNIYSLKLNQVNQIQKQRIGIIKNNILCTR